MTRADMNETRIAPELWLANLLGITPRLSTIERNEFIKEVKGAFFSEIERLLKEAGQLRPPIDPTQLFGSRKIDKMTSSDDVFEHGKLLVSPSGFSIVVSTRISGTHARFVIAHEICHTFPFGKDIFEHHSLNSLSGIRIWRAPSEQRPSRTS